MLLDLLAAGAMLPASSIDGPDPPLVLHWINLKIGTWWIIITVVLLTNLL